MVAKSKAGTTAQIKKKIEAARTEADRRALVFELKKAEKAEKTKPVKKVTSTPKTRSKPKTKSKAANSAKASVKKPAAKSTNKPAAKSGVKAKQVAAPKTTKSNKPNPKPKAKARIVAKDTSAKETAKKPKSKFSLKVSSNGTKKPKDSTKAKAVSTEKNVKLAKKEAVQAKPKAITKKAKAAVANPKSKPKPERKSESKPIETVSKAKKVDVAKAKVAETKAAKPKLKIAIVKKVVKKKEAIKAAPEQKQAKSVETATTAHRQLATITERASDEKLQSLAGEDPYLEIENLYAGYGKLEILKNFNLTMGRKQSLCLISTNGGGKSTVLHAIFGFNNIFSGTIKLGNGPDKQDITELSPNQKVSEAGIAYIMQDKSVVRGMTVEENLWLGGFLKNDPAEAKRATEQVFDKYPRLAKRRKRLAKSLSSGERRLVEICRALVMDPQILLVDEPSLGLKPRSADMIFEFLHDLQHKEDKTIILVENDVRRGLEFADIGYVLVNGEVALADTGDNLLANTKIGELFPAP